MEPHGQSQSSFLHRELVYDTFTLSPYVMEHDTQSPSEGDVEGPSHVLDILIFLINFVPLTTNLESNRCKSFLKVTLAKLWVVVHQSLVSIERMVVFLTQLAGLESRA